MTSGIIQLLYRTFTYSEYFSESEKFHGFRHINKNKNKNKNKFISEQKKKWFHNFYKYLNISWKPILWVLPLSHRLPKQHIVQK